jgi:hypothetical protein
VTLNAQCFRHVYAQFDNVANVWRCTKCGRADHEPTAAVEDARTGSEDDGWGSALGL